jgi:hypothetical protein
MSGFWKNRTHNLARMSLKDLFRAFFTYPSVLAYIVIRERCRPVKGARWLSIP